jgi:protein-tyrosine kinase
MSRIEQALEKAAHLRNSSGVARPNEAVNAPVQAVRRHIPPAADSAGVELRIDNPLLATLSDPHSPVSEEYRKLKSTVTAFAKQERFRNVIMVTSSVSGEGKSITSLNLAITLAQEIDHTVLLIDADLRKPSLQEYLGMEPAKGLSEYLNGKAALNDLLIKAGVGKLTLLPAGAPLRNPVELFSSQMMRDFIMEIKNRYPDRFIIIDTPPVLPFAESRSLAALVDGILFVVGEGKASPENINEAISSLESSRLIGAVYNAATVASLNGHYHYYYHGYGYGYGKQDNADKGRRPAEQKQGTGGFLKRMINR